MYAQSPLQGLKVVELTSGVAGAYAGRLLCAMGAETTLVEPAEGCELRRSGPLFADEQATSALFTYLAAGKRNLVCDLDRPDDREGFDCLLSEAQVFIDDTPLAQRTDRGLDEATIARRFPHLVHVSVLPFGAFGPKARWLGAEINMINAAGEGYLLPNGLSASLFPDRPPLKIAGHFAEFQGGVAAALGVLAAVFSDKGQFVDISVQDANVAVGAFAIQRNGDGSVEHRATRSFRYGGVIECADGFVELLTLEERQWEGLVHLMGDPHWATDPLMRDGAHRSANGTEINDAIRAWALGHGVAELVERAQALGVPMAPYMDPGQILAGRHETARGLFAPVDVPGVGRLPLQTAPFRFGPDPLPALAGPPGLCERKTSLARPDLPTHAVSGVGR